MSLCPHNINIKHRRCDACEEVAEAEHRNRGIDFASAPQRKALRDAVKLCTYLEKKLRPIGWHVGLTGSRLYGKLGKLFRTRPDIDVIFYPNNDTQPHDETPEELFKAAGIKDFRILGLDENYQRDVYSTTTRDGDIVHFFIFR